MSAGHIVTIEFEILDLYPFRNMLEILKGYRDMFVLRFWPTHIEIVASGKSSSGTGDDEKSSHRYIIYGDQILNYRYPVKTIGDRQVPVHDHISLEVKASDILGLTKGQNRVDTLNASATVDLENSIARGIYITAVASSRSLPLSKLIQVISCHLGPPAAALDYYERFFSKRYLSFPDRIDKPGVPNSRVSTTAFSKFLVELKASKCTRLDVTLTDDKHIDIKAYTGPTFIIGGTLPESGLDIALSQNCNPTQVIDCGDGLSIISENYTISINIKDVEWLEKVEKLAKMSILEIFMEEGYPLVFRTKLGLYGDATFTLNN